MTSDIGKRQDLKIVGEGTSGGGQFHRVRVTGEAAFEGNLECSAYRIVGNTTHRGDLQAETTRIIGECEVSGSFTGHTLRLTGSLATDGNCTVETLSGRGAFTIGGLLNADKIDVRLYGPSQAREIGGSKIEVRRRRFHSKDSSVLDCESIEGDNIYLEHTRAKVVRGNHVRLGPGCDIDEVEYHATYNCSDHSRVGASKQM